MRKKPTIPEELLKITDTILAYTPPPKSRAAKKRAEQVKLIDPYKNKKAAD